MARSSTPPLLSELRSASSAASLVKALKQLKNEVIGHAQRKQQWIELGILKHLVRILSNPRDQDNAIPRNAGHENRSRWSATSRDGDEAKLQAIIIIGSFAHDGPAFVPPLYASHAIPSMLKLLAPDAANPPIVLQVLHTINNTAESCCLATPEHSLDEELLHTLYSFETLRNLAILLTEQDRFGSEMPQVQLIADIVINTCRKEHHRVLLDDASVLEALAGHLKSWIASTFNPQVEDFYVRWEPRLSIRNLSDNEILRHSVVLHAIGVVISFSRTRAQRLLSTCESIFQFMDQQFTIAWNQFTVNVPQSLKGRVSRPPTCVECLVPTVPTLHLKIPQSHAVGYPPLDPIKTTARLGTRSLSTAVEIFSSHGLERIAHDESPLIAWLIHMARTPDPLLSLSSAWLLAALYQLGITGQPRENDIALLVVPSLVRTLDRNFMLPVLQGTQSTISSGDRIRSNASATLARLTSNNPRTQKAAVDAGAIKNLSQLLRKSCDVWERVDTNAMWRPSGFENSALSQHHDDSARLGPTGIAPQIYHKTRIRESALVALAALASSKDEYRKAIIDSGVVPFVIRTLGAEEMQSIVPTANEVIDSETIEKRIAQGICRESILAACGFTRALSRSVGTLRTSLMDAGLVPPLFALLKSNDVSLKVHSTAAMCNLCMEFSPMQEAILEGGILRVLCDHAHSNYASLRLNSLWALKHLLSHSSLQLKIQVLENLGAPWLKQLISSDPEIQNLSRNGDREDGNTTPMRMSTPNAAGEQVDLLNAVDGNSRESSLAPEDEGDEDTRMSDSYVSLSKSDESLPKSRSQLSRTRPTLTQNTHNPTYQVSRVPDDIAILQEGLLIVQNLLLGSDTPSGNNETETINFVLREFGQDDLLRTLCSKLRPRILNPFRDRTNRPSSPHPHPSIGSGLRHIQPHPEIFLAALRSINNIAASRAHKSLIMNFPKLLELVLPALSHPDPHAREMGCWIVTNLTWDDDANDQVEARLRVRKLVELGFWDRVREMAGDMNGRGEGGDPDLNCKERARNAWQQMQSGSR